MMMMGLYLFILSNTTEVRITSRTQLIKKCFRRRSLKNELRHSVRFPNLKLDTSLLTEKRNLAQDKITHVQSCANFPSYRSSLESG